MKKYVQVWLMVFMLHSACNTAQKAKEMPADELKKEAVDTLRKVMTEQQQWVKVHAAEFLIWTGNEQGVKQDFLKELELFHQKPQYRIGIWRVLAQVSDSAGATRYKKQIVNAFLDTAGKDRIHAIETMAKLKMSPLPDYPFETQDALKSNIKSLSAYAHWAIAYTNADSMQSAKKYFLGRLLDPNEDILQQRIAAYVLRNSGMLELADWNILQDTALKLPDEAGSKISFLNAALLTAPPEAKSGETYRKIFNRLLAFGNKNNKGLRMDIAAGLAAAGTGQHLPLLKEWMHNTDPTGVAADDADVQASAAYAILEISGRMNEKK
jgi:SSS family solute:Na+ symporter